MPVVSVLEGLFSYPSFPTFRDDIRKGVLGSFQSPEDLFCQQCLSFASRVWFCALSLRLVRFHRFVPSFFEKCYKWVLMDNRNDRPPVPFLLTVNTDTAVPADPSFSRS
jgi:hypothetical protein